MRRITRLALAVIAAVSLTTARDARAITPTPTVTLPVLTVPSDITVPETAGKVTLTITKDAAAVDYSEVWVNTSDVGQTAMAGRDFVALSHNVDFDNKETSRTFTLTIYNRHGIGGDRSFIVKFKSQRFATLSAPQMTVHITSVAPPAAWVAAPLQDGNYARVTAAADADWDVTGPGAGRPLVVGEIVAVYFNGWGSDVDNQTSYAVYALSDGTYGRIKASHLEGVAPTGSPPGLPSDWWVPGLVTANKTCPYFSDASKPGVTVGGVYRARMAAGGHMKLTSGQTGYAGTEWIVTATGDLNGASAVAQTAVDGACLTGNA